jgi:hypothetical protein
MSAPKPAKHPNISAAITNAALRNQVVNIGDTDHSSPQLREFLTSPELLDAAKKGGIKHIFIELDSEAQYIVNDLINGEISRDEFISQMSKGLELSFADGNEAKRQYGQIADFILGAKERGMMVHFGDQNILEIHRVTGGDIPGYMDAKVREMVIAKHGLDDLVVFKSNFSNIYPEIMKHNPGFFKVGEEEFSKVVQDTPSAMALLKNLSPEELATFLKVGDDFFKCKKEIFNDLRVKETDSIEYALEVAGDQKFMMIWGAGHDAPRAYLNNLRIKNHTIDIVDPTGPNKTGYSGERAPDTKAILSEDRVIKTEATQPPVVVKPRSELQSQPVV